MAESPTQPALAVAIGAGSPSRGVERMEQQARLQESSGSGSPTLEVPPEVWIGQELRRIGDEFNTHYHTGRGRNQGWRLWTWLIVLLRRMIDGV